MANRVDGRGPTPRRLWSLPRSGQAAVVVTAIAGLVLAPGSVASAHEKRRVGDLKTTVGWLDEPAVAGFMNAVQLFVSRDGNGSVAGARLRVQVIYGDADADVRSEPLDLESVPGAPGEYRASLVPTRPGTYTLRVFGTVGPGDRFEETYTSGDGTFPDVLDPGTVQFPARDPSSGELATRLDRLASRLEAATSAAEEAAGAARDTARTARTLALAAIATGVAGLALGLVAILRRPGR